MLQNMAIVDSAKQIIDDLKHCIRYDPIGDARTKSAAANAMAITGSATNIDISGPGVDDRG